MGRTLPELPLESTEADFGEGPVTVYFRPKASLHELSEIEQAQKRGSVQMIIEILFQRARTDANVRMFPSQADRERITGRLDPDEVRRVVDVIVEKTRAAANPGN